MALFAVLQREETHPFKKSRIQIGVFGSCSIIHAVILNFLFHLLPHTG